MGNNMGGNMGGNMGSHERYLKKNAATQERRRARIRAEGYKCKVEGCGEAFMTVALLRRHNNNHNEEFRKRMKCNKAKCGAKFDNRTDYDKHLDKHKEEDKAKVINMIRSVLLYNKHGLLMKSFKREFRSVTGMKVPHEMMGFSSLNDLLTNLPDVVQVTNLPEGHILLLAVPDKATEHIAKLVANQITNRKEFNFRTWEVLGKVSSDTIRMIEECVESNIRRVPESKSMRKLFIGGLNYQTTEEELRAHFEQFGEIVDCAIMKFNDTGRSRGFGFVTYDKASQLDDCQAARPHDLGGKTLETKRATPRADAGKPEAQASVRKIFIGGVTDEMEDDDIRDHFEQYGKVTNIEQMRWNDTGKKRGFGFVEFDDYDAVDKVVLVGRHVIKTRRLEVKKALSKQEMGMLRKSNERNDVWGGNNMGMGMGGGGRGGRGDDMEGHTDGVVGMRQHKKEDVTEKKSNSFKYVYDLQRLVLHRLVRTRKLSEKFLVACADGNLGVAKACLRIPNSLDINYSDGTATPLTAALASYSHVLVQMVIDQKGVDVNKAACNRWTPLHLACLTGNTRAIVRLREHSSLDTVNTKDDEGETPIMLAVWEGNTEAVKEMVKIPGIELNTTNKWGDTLVDVCR